MSGDLEISAEFQLPSSLFVTVRRAHSLTARDEGKTADPFVKLTVTGTSSMFQTQVGSSLILKSRAYVYLFTIISYQRVPYCPVLAARILT